MDGFTGFKTAAAEELPTAVAVMDPFHVVRLGGNAMDSCRRRVQQELHGHRGLAGDALYRARRTLHTGEDLLTDRQRERLMLLFADDDHVEVEATWGIVRRMIAAYRHPDRAAGRAAMTAVIDALRDGVPGRSGRAAAARSHLEPTGRRRARLLRPARHQQRPDRGPQRPARTPPRLRPRLPQPHQLHRQVPPGDRRLQAGRTPRNAMSPLSPAGLRCSETAPLAANVVGQLVASTGIRQPTEYHLDRVDRSCPQGSPAFISRNR